MIGESVAYPAHATFAQAVDRLGRVTLIKNKQSKDKFKSLVSDTPPFRAAGRTLQSVDLRAYALRSMA